MMSAKWPPYSVLLTPTMSATNRQPCSEPAVIARL
jgi:hypothetical protein